MPKQCDGDCLSCGVDTYITCEKRINPDMKYSALERLDIKFTELIGAIEEKQIDGTLSNKDHGDYELVCYCRGFIRAELKKERRSCPHTPAPAPTFSEEECEYLEELILDNIEQYPDSGSFTPEKRDALYQKIAFKMQAGEPK